MIGAALLLVALQGGAPVVIRVTGPAENCRATLNGRSFDPRVDSAERDAALATVPNAASVRVVADAAIPYRCIGGVIYDLQRRGHARVDVVMDAAPAPAPRPAPAP